MASTYPLEVVEADRWVEANKTLKGDTLKAAVDKQSWDDSVKSLVATPSVLDVISQNCRGRSSSAMPCWRSTRRHGCGSEAAHQGGQQKARHE